MRGCCDSKVQSARPASCPRCHVPGKSVPDETPAALLRRSCRERLGPGPHHFCTTAHCEVVYFSADGPAFLKDEVRVRVGEKETSPPITVCYCFAHTVESIDEEIRSTGTTTVLERIRAEVASGRCRCERENPRGSCCLGNVARTVQSLRLERSSGARRGTAGRE